MEIKARIPGTVLAVKANVGDQVAVRGILGTIEAMKMEQPVLTPVAGTVKEVKIAVGDKVKSGQLMFVVE